MKPEIRRRWVDALRSGEYKQARNTLRKGESFCCLGVLCDLVRDEVEGEWSGDLFAMLESGKQSNVNPPQSVVRYAGIRNDDPLVEFKNKQYCLTALNDTEKLSFAQIADLIEAQL